MVAVFISVNGYPVSVDEQFFFASFNFGIVKNTWKISMVYLPVILALCCVNYMQNKSHYLWCYLLLYIITLCYQLVLSLSFFNYLEGMAKPSCTVDEIRERYIFVIVSIKNIC